MCLEIEGSFFIIYPALLCEYLASYVALEFCVRFQSFQEFVCLWCGIPTFHSIHQAWECWNDEESVIWVWKSKRNKTKKTSFFIFSIQSLWELRPRFKPWVSLGWAGEADPSQFWQHIWVVYHMCFILFFWVFFFMYSTRLVGIQRTRLVADTWCNDDTIFIMDDGCWIHRAASFSEFKVEKP